MAASIASLWRRILVAPALGVAVLPAASLAQSGAALSNWQGYATSSALAAPVFSVPGTLAEPPPPPVHLTFGLGAQQAITDNAYLIPDGASVIGARNTDTITIFSPAVLSVIKTRRLDMAVNYTGTYDSYRNDRQLDGWDHEGLAQASLALLEKELYLDSSATISEQAINPSSASAAGSRTLAANRNEVLAYQAGPRWQEALSDDLVGQAVANYGQTVNHASASNGLATPLLPTAGPGNGANLANAIYGHARAELRSMPDADSRQWVLSSDGTETRETGETFRQVVHQGALEQRVADDWGLLATVGEQRFAGAGLSGSINGPFANGGLHWHPSPDTDLRLTDGHRAGGADLQALFNAQIGPRTVLRLRRTVTITDDPQSLFDSLGSLQHDTQGAFVDPFSGVARNALSSSYQLTNQVYRLKSSSLSLSHGDPRDSLSLTIEYDDQSFLAGPPATTGGGAAPATNSAVGSLNLTANWRHNLTHAASVRFSLNDSDILSAGPGQPKSQTISSVVEWTYALNATLQVQATYRLSDTLQNSVPGVILTTPAGRIKEDYASLGIRKSF